MTVKEQQNHYNVKGRGCSAFIKNSKNLKSKYDHFSQSTIEEWFVKNMPYEKISMHFDL